MKNCGFLCLVDAAWVDHGGRVVEAQEAPYAPTEVLTVVLRAVRLHADLRVTRVQVRLAHLLRDRLHAILADLAHPTHFCAIVHRTCSCHVRCLLLSLLSNLLDGHNDVLIVLLVHHFGGLMVDDIFLDILG